MGGLVEMEVAIYILVREIKMEFGKQRRILVLSLILTN